MRPHFLQPLLGAPASPRAVLVVEGATTPLASTVEGAFDSETRRRGLLDRETLAPDSALIIAPCSAIHTIGMRFSIDVIFTDRDGIVLKIAHDVAPRRVAVRFGAFAAVEMAAGEAARHGLEAGNRLAIRRGDTSA